MLKTLALLGAMTIGLLASSPARAQFWIFGVAQAPTPDRLLSVAQRDLGRGNFTGINAAWCAAALGRWLHEAGYSRLASLRAVDYRRYGRATSAHVGAIAVLAHHVGIVAGFSPNGVVLLSGNHRRRVGLGVYSAWRILAFREAV